MVFKMSKTIEFYKIYRLLDIYFNEKIGSKNVIND